VHHGIKLLPLTTSLARIPEVTEFGILHRILLKDVIRSLKFHIRQAIDKPPICRMSQTILSDMTCCPARIASMPPTIRPARPDEYDEIARVWMNSWASTGLEDASQFLLAKLRARVRLEVENGWSLFVADDGGTLAAMLALHLPNAYLDQLFVAPEYQGRNLGRRLLAFTRQHLPDEIYLRCVRENEKAWRWYERESFVFEKEEVEPMTGFVMKYYRWKKQGTVR
jgi:GNAT superfamily N-acetyltransferase